MFVFGCDRFGKPVGGDEREAQSFGNFEQYAKSFSKRLGFVESYPDGFR